MSATHLVADETTAPTALAPTVDPGWLTLSAAVADEVPTIADREDLLVTIAPGAGHGAPACFLPAHAMIEIDGKHFYGFDPSTLAPHRVSDRARYAAAWGLLTHECAHARHSLWEAPPDTPADVVAAAELLEESRIEAAQIRRRPDDRHWLRASATRLILNDTKALDPDDGPKLTRRDAAQSAALLLARTDGGILNRRETAPVARAVRKVLGTDTLRRLRGIWRSAHKVADHDAEAMIELGRRWCDLVGTEPTDSTTPPPDMASTTLADAIRESVRRTRAAVRREPVPADPAEPTVADKAAENAAEKAARDAAVKVARGIFSTSGPTNVGTATAGTRQPTTNERTAARQLARALDTAGIRDRVATKTSSATPPGRLRMRGALAADAQRAAGALPTAEPFTRITRRTAPTPPLRLGIACDVSASMTTFARPVASAAWILAHAARHTRVPATTATVIFGNQVRPITHPGGTPTQVTDFYTDDTYEAIDTAIDALDGALDLTRPDAARLLVIVSDGRYMDEPREKAQQRLNRLRAAGCGVLWLTPDGRAYPLDGATVQPLDDPTATAQAIGHAATAALRATR